MCPAVDSSSWSPTPAWLTDWPDQKLARLLAWLITDVPFGVSTQAGGNVNHGPWEGATAAMVMLAESVDAVIGVDTHTDTHTACMLDHLGREIGSTTVEADPEDGRRRLRGSSPAPD